MKPLDNKWVCLPVQIKDLRSLEGALSSANSDSKYAILDAECEDEREQETESLNTTSVLLERIESLIRIHIDEAINPPSRERYKPTEIDFSLPENLPF